MPGFSARGRDDDTSMLAPADCAFGRRETECPASSPFPRLRIHPVGAAFGEAGGCGDMGAASMPSSSPSSSQARPEGLLPRD